MTTTSTVHAALTANRFFKAFVGADGPKPKPEHLAAALKSLVMGFDNHWVGIPDGGSYPRDGVLKDTQKAVSMVAYNSMEKDAQIALSYWEDFWVDGEPTEALQRELHKVVMNNFRDSRTHNDIDKMYIPVYLEDEDKVHTSAEFIPLVGEQLGLAANKFFGFIPSSYKGNDNVFHNKLNFEFTDIEKLAEVVLEELPQAADSRDIDHFGVIDEKELFNMRTGDIVREHTVHLDTVELELAGHYQERFRAWLSHASHMNASNVQTTLEVAAERVVSAAEYGREMARERSKKTFETMFGNVA